MNRKPIQRKHRGGVIVSQEAIALSGILFCISRGIVVALCLCGAVVAARVVRATLRRVRAGRADSNG